jgi:ATP-binding protein involved in chromosome partitioning
VVAVSLKNGWCEKLAVQLRDEVLKVDGVTDVDIDIQTKIAAHAVQKGVEPLKGVKNVIAVASGKGGVGKSTVSVNLALALAAEGATVGIMDADIYGPSQPRMLGLSGRPDSDDGQSLEPMVAYKIQSMSIGYLVDQDQPMIWRGPMVTQALDQLIHETNWKDVDYLIIDLPPGTGDVQLTLAQKIPVSGAVIVTTPQEIALLDARKGLKMFEKVEVPVLGIVENMSTHVCSSCGHEEHIFGAGGGVKMAEQADVTFLGALPLDMRIREETDNGRPTVVAEPESTIAQSYRAIARRVAGKLSMQAKNFAARFPSIVIDNA